MTVRFCVLNQLSENRVSGQDHLRLGVGAVDLVFQVVEQCRGDFDGLVVDFRRLLLDRFRGHAPPLSSATPYGL